MGGGIATTLDGGIKSVFGNGGNHTYDEKVLSDGSVVKINRTTFHNTDEDGNGFIFHSSVHHVVSDDKNLDGNIETADETEEKTKDEEEEPENDESVEQDIQSNTTENVESIDNEDIENESTEDDFIPLSENNENSSTEGNKKNIENDDVINLGDVKEEENEIDVDVKLPTIDVLGVDDGLFQ